MLQLWPCRFEQRHLQQEMSMSHEAYANIVYATFGLAVTVAKAGNATTLRSFCSYYVANSQGFVIACHTAAVATHP